MQPAKSSTSALTTNYGAWFNCQPPKNLTTAKTLSAIALLDEYLDKSWAYLLLKHPQMEDMLNYFNASSLFLAVKPLVGLCEVKSLDVISSLSTLRRLLFTYSHNDRNASDIFQTWLEAMPDGAQTNADIIALDSDAQKLIDNLSRLLSGDVRTATNTAGAGASTAISSSAPSHQLN